MIRVDEREIIALEKFVPDLDKRLDRCCVCGVEDGEVLQATHIGGVRRERVMQCMQGVPRVGGAHTDDVLPPLLVRNDLQLVAELLKEAPEVREATRGGRLQW